MPFPPPEVQLLPPVRPPMSEKAIAGTERLIMLHEQEQARLERKRKAEEARIAKEHEAQDKRMKKEMERQEAMRRKKEDQERKESEKVHREKQKELERLAREKAREEERLQRQHKKEYERMEKLLQKENQRVAKLRQKEEMRREKEATKLRAAYERATAKKLAKLSTGLIDDEQLELMQMGAFVQGLISGSEFDPNKIELPMFPPASVRMKPPIGVPPWNDSNHNVANLFMVWRMLTNFADVIGLWPFTLDEFVQALHDYDSRLLGEIHIALLKTLVKDVKDASQAAAIGSNQALAVASGGHPELVEAAYAWGFDIQEWGQHVNALTWPEILRQFALASGYGPRWKKKITETAPSTPVAEGKNAEDAVANLRSGAAAANAVTQMRGRNSSRVRKQQQQHKPVLTPGTVKFAAFQVLSVEGSKGLTILEVVDRVQKAGLRDLSTSKTPEASISAVLSRDTKLFERVAPSTYCVRPVFRKSPEEAEAVLQAAREKIRQCESRLSDAEPEPLEEDIIEEAEEREEEEECDEQDIEETEEREVKNETATTTISTIETTVTTTTTNNSPSSSGKVILRLKVGKLTPSSDAPAVESGQKEECVKAEPERLHSSLDMNVESVEGLAQESSDGMEIDESQNKKIFRYYKDLITNNEKLHPSLLLRRINPSEAALADSATGLHIRFRLGGITFPPLLLYKLYTHRPVVDMGSFSPRKYSVSLRRPLTRGRDPRRCFQQPVKQTTEEYVRCENNGWRLVCDTAWMHNADELIHDKKEPLKIFYPSVAARREHKAQESRKKKRAWLNKLYKEGRLAEIAGTATSGNSGSAEDDNRAIELFLWSLGERWSFRNFASDRDGANAVTGAPKTSEAAASDPIGEEMRADTFVMEDTEVDKDAATPGRGKNTSGGGGSWMDATRSAVRGVVDRVKQFTGTS
ncbi:hypothetical protein SELMODRAFT_422901 [Selaginella moellendorffii]|uniref:Uncharacterized protein n=1 Tax=Selaginella moellendorffii TaxID=88036 RepID=D8SJX3_SELML|nr:hypothetical protein SELMODRAFT_422901 [Selaginella moellendorffii]